MPRRHNDDDLRPRCQTGLEGILPLRPQLAAVGLAVRLFAVFDRVVDDEQVCRVARDAGHHAARDHAAPAVAQLKLGRRPDVALLKAKERRAELLDLLDVLPAKAFGRVVVVTRQDHAVAREAAQVPARKALRDRHGLAVLRRRFNDENVICVPRVLLDELLNLVRQIVAHARPLPQIAVNVVQVAPVGLARQLAPSHLAPQIFSIAKTAHQVLRFSDV